ncbi:GNAT family N-acetyltransferase [Pararhodospirillum photometricum]|nr:GNAT family N-acetyltransferase [Pararhodospirillum photometricum]
MSNALTIRDATDADALPIAALMLQAGEGLYEFLLDGLVPDLSAQAILAHLIEAGDGPLGWPECRVAEREGQVLGMVNAFPVERLDELALDMIPLDRTTHLAPLFQARDPGSFYLSTMAVVPTQRGVGIGVALIAEVLGMAGARKIPRVSLHVWSTNKGAIALYERLGFTITGQVTLPSHDRLSARRALLMARAV